ncbi:MAG: hypothetical protein ACI943_000614 [Gammaproteobacteria bacterium]|jgi:hypothetical protein
MLLNHRAHGTIKDNYFFARKLLYRLHLLCK